LRRRGLLGGIRILGRGCRRLHCGLRRCVRGRFFLSLLRAHEQVARGGADRGLEAGAVGARQAGVCKNADRSSANIYARVTLIVNVAGVTAELPPS
jgi:hypothetical protein